MRVFFSGQAESVHGADCAALAIHARRRPAVCRAAAIACLIALCPGVPSFAGSGSTSATGSDSGAAPAVSAPVVTMPEAPTVTAPTAPVLSPETITGSTANAAGTSAIPNASGASAKKNGGTAAGKSSSKTAAPSLSGTSASALSMLGLGSDSALLKALSGTDSDEAGLDALSTLLGGSSSSSKTAASTDQETLEKILALLQKQQESATGKAAAATTSGKTAVTADASAAAARITSGGELVRFTVNGTSVLSSVKDEVSSVLARDGSFLITCDRSFPVSGRQYSESFYLLCRKTGKTAYRLYADVSQSEPNANSFPYRLSRKTPIAGTLTGDLLVFRSSEANWKLDLVIRVISPTAR